MPLSDEEKALFQGSNVVALPRAAAAGQPEPAAKAFNLAQDTGVPASIISGDLDGFQQTTNRQRAAFAISQNSLISDYVARNKSAADVSNDDYDKLDNLSQKVHGLSAWDRFQKLQDFRFNVNASLGRDIYKAAESLVTSGYRMWQDAQAIQPGQSLSDLPPERQREYIGASMEAATFGSIFSPMSMRARPLTAEKAPKPGEVSLDEFFATLRGMKTRAEIDAFLNKGAKTPGPEQPLAIEFQGNRTKAEASAFDQAMQAATETATRERAPGLLEDFVRGHETDTVRLPAQAIADVYAAEGKVPAKGDGLFGFVPNLQQKLALGLNTGAEIQVPVASYLAHVDPTVHEKVKENIRFTEDGLSQFEVTQIKEQTKAEGTSIEAFHGSPHTFDAFSLEKIGTGEGAQSYGHGLYFAEAKAVAESYKRDSAMLMNALPENYTEAQLRVAQRLYDNKGDIKQATNDLQNRITNSKMYGDTPESLAQLQEELALIKSGWKPPESQLYRVAISANREAFLDWDKPLSEQPQVVERLDPKFRQQLEELLESHDQVGDLKEYTGNQLYQLLQRYASEDALPGDTSVGGNPKKEASEFLHRLGIPGIKYLDQGSRVREIPRNMPVGADSSPSWEIGWGTPHRKIFAWKDYGGEQGAYDAAIAYAKDVQAKGTSNFVIFDPSIVTILERNGQKLRDTAQAEEQSLGLRPLLQQVPGVKGEFAEPIPGMTEADFNRYNKRVAEAQQQILDKATALEKREVAKTQTATWKANEAALKPEVEAQVRVFPDIAADRYLRTGEMPDGTKVAKVRLDEDYVKALLNNNQIPATMLGKGGSHPDDIAPLFGYRSGAEMVRQLNDLQIARKEAGESPLKHFNRLVNEELAFQMEQKYGNLAETIAQEARALATNDLHYDILSDEMRWLAGAAGVRPPLTKDGIKEFVKDRFSELNVKDAADFKHFQKAAERQGLETERAFLTKDYMEAFESKQRQTLSFLLAKEADALRRFVARTEALFQKYAQEANLPNVDQSFTNQIHRLLMQYNYPIRRDPTNIRVTTEGTSLEGFVRQRRAAGDLIMDPDLPVTRDIENFTVEEFRDFADFIRNLDHLGRDAQRIIVNNEKMDYTQAVAEIRNNLDALTKKPFDPKQTNLVGRGLRNVDARLLKAEQLFDWIDMNDPLGPMNSSVYRALVEGEGKKHDMVTKLAGEVQKLGTTREWSRALNDKVDTTGITRPEDGSLVFPDITRENMITIALNFGNASNIDVMTRGHNWTKDQIQDLLYQNMTREDWKFVQGIWDLWNNLAPLVEAETTRRSGVPIKMVEKQPVKTQFGEIPGGYYPLIKDPTAVTLGKQETGDLFETAFFNPLPMARALKRRTGAAYPLNLTINAMTHRMNETIHAVYMGEAVANANKVLSDPLVKQGVANAFGIEYVQQFRPWLEDIANNGGAFDDSMLVWLSRNARENVVAMLMGFKVSTAVIHGGSALSSSIYEVGATPFVKAVKELGLGQFLPQTIRRMYANDAQMVEMIRWANEMSPELRNRQRAMSKDFNYQLDQVVSKNLIDDAANVRAAYLTWAMSMVGYLDQLSATPVWVAAFEKAVRVDKLDETDAIFAADKAVRQAHGSASLVNRANIGRGEVNRWLTFAYNGYWNHNYNRTRSAYRDTTEEGINFTDRLVAGSAALTALIVIPGLVHYAVRGTDTKTWEGMAAETLISQFGGQVPGVNAVTSSFIHNRDPSLSPMDDILKGGTVILKDAKKLAEGKKTDQWLKHVIETPGWLFGLGPTRQLSTAAQFQYDVMKQKEHPKSVMEYLRGLITGHAQKKKH